MIAAATLGNPKGLPALCTVCADFLAVLRCDCRPKCKEVMCSKHAVSADGRDFHPRHARARR